MDIKTTNPAVSSPQVGRRSAQSFGGDGGFSTEGFDGRERIQNENGVVLTGPAFYRGGDEIRDIASFTTEALDALAASQGEV